MSVDNNRLDLHTQKISNLTAPIETKDAVTKAYLNNKTDLLINRINDVEEKYKNSLRLLQQEINHSLKTNNEALFKETAKIENIQTNSIISISKGIENIKINAASLKNIKIDNAVLKENITQEINNYKKENQNIKKELNEVNKLAFEYENRFNNIGNYLFKNLLSQQKKLSENKTLQMI